MSPPASERAEPIAPHVHVTHILRPSYGARTAQRAVPTTALTFSYYQKDGQMSRVFRDSQTLCDPSRVKPVWRMSPGVAACGLTPGYILATLQVAKNSDSIIAANR